MEVSIHLLIWRLDWNDQLDTYPILLTCSLLILLYHNDLTYLKVCQLLFVPRSCSSVQPLGMTYSFLFKRSETAPDPIESVVFPYLASNCCLGLWQNIWTSYGCNDVDDIVSIELAVVELDGVFSSDVSWFFVWTFFALMRLENLGIDMFLGNCTTDCHRNYWSREQVYSAGDSSRSTTGH